MNSMPRRPYPAIILATVATLIFLRSVQAQILIPISQSRNIQASSSSDLAAGFGPFDSMVQADDVFGEATVHATASQQSQIGSTSLSGIGSITHQDIGLGFSGAQSFFRVTIELPAANNLSKFVVSGQLNAQAMPSDPNVAAVAFADIILTGPGTQTVFSHTVGFPGQPNSLAVAEAGVLPPGRYTLVVSARSFIDDGGFPQFTADATFDFTFDVSILGDVDTDGDADFVDLGAMVAVLIGAPLDPAHMANADLNGDGSANGDDIQLMVDALLFVPPPPPGPPVNSVTYMPGPTVSNCPFSFTVAAVTGNSFDPNVIAKLTQTGQPDIPASSISFTDSTFFEANFDDLSGIAPGTWQLEIANPGTAFTFAPDTLTVVQCPS